MGVGKVVVIVSMWVSVAVCVVAGGPPFVGVIVALLATVATIFVARTKN